VKWDRKPSQIFTESGYNKKAFSDCEKTAAWRMQVGLVFAVAAAVGVAGWMYDEW
jgi:hypothetical protein